MAAEQKLTLDVGVKGANKAAQDLKGVSDAQKNIGASASDASAQQEKFTASNEDFAAVLNKIAPGLGEWFQTVTKGTKVISDLAGRNFSLIDTFKSLAGSITKNTGALQLMLAGGAVAAGIYAVIQALQAQREEHERVTKAINDQAKALDELEAKRRERGQSIENISDQRPGGGFSEEQARAATNTAQRISEKSPFLDPESVNAVIGVFGGASDSDTGGGQFNIDQLQRLAFLQQTGRIKLDPKLGGDRLAPGAQRNLDKYSSEIDAAFARESGGGKLGLGNIDVEAARLQALAGKGGHRTDLVDLLRRLAPAGSDIESIADAVQTYGNEAGLRDSEGNTQQKVGPGYAKLRSSIGLPIEETSVQYPAEIMAVVRQAFQEFKQELSTVSNELRRAAQRPPSTNIAVQRVAGIAAFSDVAPVNGRTKGHDRQNRGN